jgi:energy-converting hydrogenase Eha subunit H
MKAGTFVCIFSWPLLLAQNGSLAVFKLKTTTNDMLVYFTRIFVYGILKRLGLGWRGG